MGVNHKSKEVFTEIRYPIKSSDYEEYNN